MTVILGRSDVPELLDIDELAAALRAGFLANHQASVPGQRVRTALPGQGTAVALLPRLMTGVPAYTVKCREITVYAPVGLPWQDLAAAWALYQKALASGCGTTIDLLR